MDEIQELKNEIRDLKKKVDNLYSTANFPDSIERILVERGFIRQYQELFFNNSSGDTFKVLLTEHGKPGGDKSTPFGFTAIGADIINRYLEYTVDPSTDVFTIKNHGLADTQQVIPYSSGSAVPNPLGVGVIYYIRDATTDTFKLAATSGGTAVDITTVGTGQQYLYIA